MSSFFFGRLTDWVLRRRGAVAVLIVLLTAFFLWKMQDLQFDNSNEIWFSEGDPSLERINTFHKLFGNDDFIYLVFDADTLFSPESLRLLSDLVSDIRKKVPYLRDVTWLGNAERIEADAEGIVVSDFIDPETYDAASMPELRRRALAEKNYRDNLISSDGKTVGMLLEMRTYPRDSVEPRSEVTHALREVLAQPEYAGFSIHAVGQPILHNDYNELSFKESATFFGLCLLVQMVLLFWLGKGVRGVIGPISVVVLSVIWTLGMIQVLGFTLNLFIILIPTLLICVCIGDSMHIIATYNQHRREGLGVVAALRQAMSETGMPCLLTSLTTAAGFLGFCAADIQPFREMGVYASVGALMAYILSILVVLLLYSTERDKAPSAPTPGMPGAPARTASPVTPIRIGKSDIFDRFLGRVYLINVRYPKVLLTLFVALLGVSVYGYTLVEVETGTARMLSKSLPLRQAYDFVDERMGGSMSVEIMLDTGRENGVKSQAFLRGLERLQQHLDVSPLVTKTVSVLDIIKKINESMHGGDKAAYALPSGDDAAHRPISAAVRNVQRARAGQAGKLRQPRGPPDRQDPHPRHRGRAPSVRGCRRLLAGRIRGHGQGEHGGEPRLDEVHERPPCGWPAPELSGGPAGRERDHVLRARFLPARPPQYVAQHLPGIRHPWSDGGVRDLHGHAAHELQRDHHRGGGRRYDTLPVSLPRILRPHRLL